MNKEILDKFMNEMADLLKTAKDFTVDQIPQVAKEVLKFNLASAIVWVILGIVGLFLSHIFHKKVKKMIEDDRNWGPMYILVVSSYVIGFFVTMGNLTEVLKIELAPRLYLLEYISSLLTPHCK